jgi:hypothetical protein
LVAVVGLPFGLLASFVSPASAASLGLAASPAPSAPLGLAALVAVPFGLACA